MLKEIRSDPSAEVLNLKASAYDLEKIVSLDLIREHCKIDDVAGASDQQLILYRRAAIKAAEHYTGFLLLGRRIITEDVYPPEFHQWRSEHDKWIQHTLQYAVSEPRVYFYGTRSMAPQVVHVHVNTKAVRLPRVVDAMGGIGCCNPCGDEPSIAKLTYVAGFSCEDDIDPIIALGVLKYIAHVLTNAGDMTIVHDTSGSKTDQYDALAQANNPAVASGAVELWRSAMGDAI